MLPDLGSLVLLQQVASTRNFRQAARQLDMSPSALSYQINRLEQQLGVLLLQRTTRSVTLTQAGELLLQRAIPALRALQQTFADLHSLAETPSGSLRINSSEGAAQLIFSRYIPPLLKLYPALRVEIVTESRLVDIVESGFDLGIRSRDLIPLDMVALPCDTPVHYVLAASPAYLTTAGMPASPADLNKHQCIRSRLPNGGPHYPWEFSHAGQQVRIDPQGALSLDSQSLQIEAALADCGLIWVNRAAITPYLASGELQLVLPEWSPPSEELCFYYPQSRQPNAAMRAFITLVRELRQRSKE